VKDKFVVVVVDRMVEGFVVVVGERNVGRIVLMVVDETIVDVMGGGVKYERSEHQIQVVV